MKQELGVELCEDQRANDQFVLAAPPDTGARHLRAHGRPQRTSATTRDGARASFRALGTIFHTPWRGSP
eukprot:scaffold27934_cov58-Phaeocystis_antarctica.AAC.2